MHEKENIPDGAVKTSQACIVVIVSFAYMDLIRGTEVTGKGVIVAIEASTS